MVGLINLGAGFAAAGQSVADTAGKMEDQTVRQQLETQKMLLADQLNGGQYDRETKAVGAQQAQLSFAMQKNKMAYLSGILDVPMPRNLDNDQGGTPPQAAPTNDNTSAQVSNIMQAPDVQTAIDRASNTAADPQSDNLVQNVLASGGRATPTGNSNTPTALDGILPPWMTKEQARALFVFNPDGLLSAIDAWMKPENLRQGSELIGPNGYSQKVPVLPETYTTETGADGREHLVQMQGGQEALQNVENVKQQAQGNREKNVAGFENTLEFGNLGYGANGGQTGQGNAAPAMAGYAERVAQLESGNNPNSTNGQSTAAGSQQFLDKTWLTEAKKYLPSDVTKDLNDNQLLGLRNDPRASALVTDGFARDNAQTMAVAGIKNISPTELYMAHHFGAQGAIAILQAPMNKPLDEILPSDVMKANPDLHGRTAGEIYGIASTAMRGVGEPEGTDQPVKSDQGTIIPPVSEAAPINRGSEYLKARIPEWGKTEGEWDDSLAGNQIAEQRTLAIADALKATQSGKWAQDKADVAATLKALGGQFADIAQQSWFGDPAKVQIALKDNFAASLEQIKQFSSRPAAAELTLAQKNFSNPDLQPAANQAIIAQTVGTLRWERAKVQDWAQAKKMGWNDPQDFERAWQKANPLQGFVDQAGSDVGTLAGQDAPKAPKAGIVQQGYRFLGGDPSNQRNWTKVQ